MKYFKVFNFHSFYELVIILELLFLPFYARTGQLIGAGILTIINLTSVYLIGCFYIKKVFIDTNEIKVIFPIRFWNRRLIIDFVNISKVEYLTGLRAPDRLKVEINNRRFPFIISVPTVHPFNQRKGIVELFESKNIPVKLDRLMMKSLNITDKRYSIKK